jgi:DNA-binding NarL/FixJ family response regulator
VTIRVLFAEDHGLMRSGICSLLRDAGHAEHVGDNLELVGEPIELVGACSDLPTLLQAIDETTPDVVLTDIRMPPDRRDEGIQVARHCRSRHPRTGVLLLSQYVDAAYLSTLLEHGEEGRGYLLKERVANDEELIDAIRAVAAGGAVIDPTVVAAAMRARRRRDGAGLAGLSPRETEVLAEMAQGRNNAAIARSLVITQRAVEKHINSVFAKLGVSTEEGVHPRVRAVLFYLLGGAR